MLMQQGPTDGQAVRVDPIQAPYRGPLPPETVRSLRKLLVSVLVASGRSQAQAGQLVNMPASSVSQAMASPEPEVDEGLPPDEPPLLEAPPPRKAPAFVEVSAKFIASIRREYLEEGDYRTRRVGSMEDVQAWLDGLHQGKVRPRRPDVPG